MWVITSTSLEILFSTNSDIHILTENNDIRRQEHFMLYLIHNKIQGMSSTNSDVGNYIIRKILFLTKSDIHILTENLNTPNP